MTITARAGFCLSQHGFKFCALRIGFDLDCVQPGTVILGQIKVFPYFRLSYFPDQGVHYIVMKVDDLVENDRC